MAASVDMSRSPGLSFSTESPSTGKAKAGGDISSGFVSLTTGVATSLPQRFAALKAKLLQGRDQEVTASWQRLLKELREEVAIVEKHGSAVIPEIAFADLKNASREFKEAVRKRGSVIIRGVVPEKEARSYKTDLDKYIKANPSTKAFPSNKPQVYEIYWSQSQLKAKAHANLLETQRFLMGFWHSDDPSALVSTAHNMSYADRLRIRQPGDAQFALGPHVDGGSCERWEETGFGKGGVYDKVWQGKWEEFDPWESSCRLTAVTDLYEGVGQCSVFRMFQGWLSMSSTSPGEGTLKVNPLLQLSISYYLLRPFFKPVHVAEPQEGGVFDPRFLEADNWILENPISSALPGAAMGRALEPNVADHPHLNLGSTMVHVPRVNPGDYVAWHCDVIHAVDKVHNGTADSSVLYIPVAPLTEANAEYLSRQRASFSAGIPPPDFPGGDGEKNHVGRADAGFAAVHSGEEGLRSMGLQAWDESEAGLTDGQQELLKSANRLLGF